MATLGEHTRAYLKEIGLSDDEIAAFSRKAGDSRAALTSATSSRLLHLRLFILLVPGLPRRAIPANLTRRRLRSGTPDDGMIWREETMMAATRARAFAPIFLVAAFGVALSASPASAQKAGGTMTVGLELDIPGFDPLKVGVYDTAALTASSAIFDTLTYLDANGKAQPRLAVVLGAFGGLQDLDLQAASGRQVP